MTVQFWKNEPLSLNPDDLISKRKLNGLNAARVHAIRVGADYFTIFSFSLSDWAIYDGKTGELLPQTETKRGADEVE
jgi:hypothetical protein